MYSTALVPNDGDQYARPRNLFSADYHEQPQQIQPQPAPVSLRGGSVPWQDTNFSWQSQGQFQSPAPFDVASIPDQTFSTPTAQPMFQNVSSRTMHSAPSVARSSVGRQQWVGPGPVRVGFPRMTRDVGSEQIWETQSFERYGDSLLGIPVDGSRSDRGDRGDPSSFHSMAPPPVVQLPQNFYQRTNYNPAPMPGSQSAPYGLESGSYNPAVSGHSPSLPAQWGGVQPSQSMDYPPSYQRAQYPLKSAKACRSRVPWTSDEEELLRSTISTIGRRWKAVAAILKTRTRDQCRERWRLFQRKEAQQRGGNPDGAGLGDDDDSADESPHSREGSPRRARSPSPRGGLETLPMRLKAETNSPNSPASSMSNPLAALSDIV